jgi:hypothetical protein
VGVLAVAGLGFYAYRRYASSAAPSPYARPGGPAPAWSSAAAAGRFSAVPTTDTLLGSGAGGYVPASINDAGGAPDQAAAYSAL